MDQRWSDLSSKMHLLLNTFIFNVVWWSVMDWSCDAVPRTLCRHYLSKQHAVLFFFFFISPLLFLCSHFLPRCSEGLVSFLITLNSAPVGDEIYKCRTKSQWSPASSASRNDHWLRLLSVEEPSFILTFQSVLFSVGEKALPSNFSLSSSSGSSWFQIHMSLSDL